MRLEALRRALAQEGGALADALAAGPVTDPRATAAAESGEGGPPGASAAAAGEGRPPGASEAVTGEGAPPGASAPALAASGPRAAARRDDYELLLEMILEGSLLHYGAPRVVRCDEPDLALLLGDRLYALGLSRLAELGDLDAVAELADVISLVAQAQAERDLALASAVWEAGAAAIGWGGGPELEAAKRLARAGDERARAALLAVRDRTVGGGADLEAPVGCRLTGPLDAA